MERKICITELANTGDMRGQNFTFPAAALEHVGRIGDVHLSSTATNAVRGNHFHLKRREALVVLPGSRWSLHWDEGEATVAQHRTFDGTCAVLMLIAPGASHAVRNDGDGLLWLVAISSENYDRNDSIARKVV